MSAELGEKERKCAGQTQDILSLSEQVQKLSAELKAVTGAKNDLTQTVIIYCDFILVDILGFHVILSTITSCVGKLL